MEPNGTMNMDDGNGVDKAKRIAEQIEILEETRKNIWLDHNRGKSILFAHVEARKKQCLKEARKYRDLQLNDVYNHFRVDVEEATNELKRGKRQLQTAMLDVAVNRRQRLKQHIGHQSTEHDTLLSGVSRRRRRQLGRSGIPISGVEKDCVKDGLTKNSFLKSLERQGIVRIGLTPDEVNYDLEIILRHFDSAQSNFASLSTCLQQPQHNVSMTPVDKIHSSKGTLHYHDITCEKGDRVTISSSPNQRANRPGIRYSGVVLSVIPKEVTIRDDDGKLLRFFFFFISISVFL